MIPVGSAPTLRQSFSQAQHNHTVTASRMSLDPGAQRVAYYIRVQKSELSTISTRRLWGDHRYRSHHGPLGQSVPVTTSRCG